MRCSYCEKDATHYAFWHRETPRPIIGACQDHLLILAAAARQVGEAARCLHPNLALKNEAAIIHMNNGRAVLHVIARNNTQQPRLAIDKHV